MKKAIFLILILFIISGCTADVNLTITDDTISEEISINYFTNDQTSKEEILNSFRKNIPAYNNVIVADTEEDEKQDGTLYYNYKNKDLGTGYNFNYKYDFPFATYNSARSVKRAFKSANFTKSTKDNIITISTDSTGIKLFEEYPELSSVTINIKTNNEVLESNGQYQNGVYTWRFNKNDYKKNIYLKMKTKETIEPQRVKTTKEENEFQNIANKNPILTIIIAIGLFVIIIALLVGLSNKKYK